MSDLQRLTLSAALLTRSIFPDSEIQLPVHCWLSRQEERAAARCKGVKAIDFPILRGAGLCFLTQNATYWSCITSWSTGREKEREIERESSFGAFHPCEDVKHHFKAPRLLHVRLPSVFSTPCQGWVSLPLSVLFTDWQGRLQRSSVPVTVLPLPERSGRVCWFEARTSFPSHAPSHTRRFEGLERLLTADVTRSWLYLHPESHKHTNKGS